MLDGTPTIKSGKFFELIITGELPLDMSPGEFAAAVKYGGVQISSTFRPYVSAMSAKLAGFAPHSL